MIAGRPGGLADINGGYSQTLLLEELLLKFGIQIPCGSKF